MTDEETPVRPLLRVVRGEPDDTELAALTAVVAALSSRPTEPEPPTRSAWSNRATAVRPTLPHGPTAWRTSALPH